MSTVTATSNWRYSSCLGRHVATEYSNLLAPRALVSMLSSPASIVIPQALSKPLPATELEELRLDLYDSGSMCLQMTFYNSQLGQTRYCVLISRPHMYLYAPRTGSSACDAGQDDPAAARGVWGH
jgi:hypothetical protein